MQNLGTKELLLLQSQALQELKSRGIIRSSNKPVGDLAEYLFCKAYGWKISNNSQSGFDAQCESGFSYQIKCRQLVNHKAGERTLSALRNLEGRKFDFLAGVLMNADYSIYRAAIIPYQVIIDSKPSYSAHDNKHIFHLRDNVWNLPGVKDATDKLKQAFEDL